MSLKKVVNDYVGRNCARYGHNAHGRCLLCYSCAVLANGGCVESSTSQRQYIIGIVGTNGAMNDPTAMTESYGPASPINFTDVNLTSTDEASTFSWFLFKVVTPIQNGIITLLGASGNSLVIYVILSNHNMRTVTNLLLLNLAVSDLCFVGIVPPFSAYQHATSSWPFGNAVCKLMHYLVNVTAYVTVYTLVLVSVIRYMTIVHSVRTASIRTRGNVLAAVAAIWVIMLAVNVPILWSYGVIGGGECHHYSMDVGRLVFVTMFAFAYVIPLAVIGVISVAILRHITGQRATSMIQQVTA